MRSLLKFGFMLVAVLSALSGCAGPSQVRLTGSPDIPGAEGVVTTSTSNDGNTKLDISVKHLAPPEKVEPGTSVFMVWVRGLEDGAQAASQGALMVNSDLIGEMETVTPLRSFELFITPESSHTVTAPTGKILLSARIEMK
jgi:hypothetical protein